MSFWEFMALWFTVSGPIYIAVVVINWIRIARARRRDLREFHIQFEAEVNADYAERARRLFDLMQSATVPSEPPRAWGGEPHTWTGTDITKAVEEYGFHEPRATPGQWYHITDGNKQWDEFIPDDRKQDARD